ncbi:WD40 repeat domain-containing protein [Knoellia flava]|nr:hypothetical protein [Knoellia flava]
MTFSTVEADARQGFDRAFAASEHPVAGTCLTWSVRDEGGAPLRAIRGDSLAAAVGLLLRELTTRQATLAHVAWRVRPQRLDRSWCITAGLDEDRLTTVKHYDSKIKAVAQLTRPLKVITAAPETGQMGVAHGVEVRVLDTLGAAVSATRTLNRGFVAALLAVVVALGTVAGAGAWVRATQLAAAKRDTATTLMQYARSTLNTDPRIAALSALAADDFDPSLRTQEVMAEVLEANQSIAGVIDLGDPVVRDLQVIGDTLLVLDVRGRVTAWDLRTRTSLGTLVKSGAGAIGPYGYSGAVILVERTLHRYLTATGYRPVEVETIETGLTNSILMGGIFQSGEGVLVLNAAFEGVYHDGSLDAPIKFDFGDDPRLERDPARRGISVRAATPGFGNNDVFLATTARQILSLDVVHDYVGAGAPKVTLEVIMTGSLVPAAPTALATGAGETLLIGTDRGVQWVDVKEGKQKEFPYAGWSQRVLDIANSDSSNHAIASVDGLSYVTEPTDDQPRPAPTRMAFPDSPITAIATHESPGGPQVFVAQENGTMTIVDPTDSRFGPRPIPGLVFASFTPSGHVLGAPPYSANASSSLTARNPLPPSPESGVVDPYAITYSLPQRGGHYPYVNYGEATQDWVVGSGRRADGHGAFWVWPISGFGAPREVSFGYGESTADDVPDIVQNVYFVAAGKEIVALNSAFGRLGFWDVTTLEELGTVAVPRYNTFSESGSVIMVTSADGKTVAVKTAPKTIMVVDVATHKVTHTLNLSDVSLTNLALNRDGSELALIDNFTTLLRVKTKPDKGGATVVLDRRDLKSVVRDLAYDPAGTHLAIAETVARKVQLLDARTLEPVGPKWAVPDGQHPMGLSWAPDGRSLVVATMVYSGEVAKTNTTRVIDAGMLTWRKQLCSIASRPFSAEEWKTASASGLDRPDSCANAGEPRGAGSSATAAQSGSTRPTDDRSTRPVNSDEAGGVTRDVLMAGAPIPEMCGHPAQAMVLGQMASPPPNGGNVWLQDVTRGDLNGDGTPEAIGTVGCSAGGASWAPWIIAWTLNDAGDPQILAMIESSDKELMRLSPEGGLRPSVTDVTIQGGRVKVSLRAGLPSDSNANPRLPLEAILDLDTDSGAFTVDQVDARFDLAATTTLFEELRYPTGLEAAADPRVTNAIRGFLTDNIGVEVGTCEEFADLPKDLRARVGTGKATGASRYCTLVTSPLRKSKPLLLRVVPKVGAVNEVVEAFP